MKIIEEVPIQLGAEVEMPSSRSLLKVNYVSGYLLRQGVCGTFIIIIMWQIYASIICSGDVGRTMVGFNTASFPTGKKISFCS